MIGAFILGGGELLIVCQRGWVGHGRFGIGVGLFETLALGLLGGAPLHVRHIRQFDDGHFTGVGAPEYIAAEFAVDTLYEGIEDDLCHA